MARLRLFGLQLCLGLMLWSTSATHAANQADSAATNQRLNLGTQPLSHPNGVIGSVIARDRILRAQLIESGTPLQSHVFKHGAGMLPWINNHKLDAGLMGDTPSTVAASTGSIWIVGLVKVQLTSVVGNDRAGLATMAGKRIGYVPISTAHTTLLRALQTWKLKPTDVKLIPYEIDKLPAALASGEIDAFAGWEPVVSIALQANPSNRIVFRGRNVDYFFITRNFAEKHPKASLAMVAGYVRAIEWMRQSSKNLETAARWSLEDAQLVTGAPIKMSVEQVMAVTRAGILDVPSAPVILPPTTGQPLQDEYDLLKSIGELPPQQSWTNILRSFQYTGLRQVMADPRQFQLRRFDYDQK